MGDMADWEMESMFSAEGVAEDEQLEGAYQECFLRYALSETKRLTPRVRNREASGEARTMKRKGITATMIPHDPPTVKPATETLAVRSPDGSDVYLIAVQADDDPETTRLEKR